MDVMEWAMEAIMSVQMLNDAPEGPAKVSSWHALYLPMISP